MKKFIKIWLIIFLFGLVFPTVVAAQTRLFFEPLGKIIQNGENYYEIALKIEPSERINALAGGFVFQPPLTAVEINDGHSVISLWLTRPTYEPPLGQVSFSGIVPGGLIERAEVFRFRVPINRPEVLPDIIWLDEETTALLHTGDGRRAALSLETIFWPRDPSTIEEIDSDSLADYDAPESFQPEIVRDLSVFGGQYFLIFATNDKKSGLARYEVAEKKSWFAQDESELNWRAAQSPVLLIDQSRKSFVYVRAIDRAGNSRLAVIHPVGWFFPPLLIFWGIIIIVAVFCLFKCVGFFTRQ